MFEKQVESVTEFTKARIEEAQENLRKVQKQVTKAVQRFVDEGNERLAPGRERIEGLVEKARGNWEEIESQISTQVTEVVNALGLPTANQVDELSRRVDKIAKKVNSLLGTKASSNGTAKASAARRKAEGPAARAAS